MTSRIPAHSKGTGRRVRIRDVAEATGLSVTTVSHALRGKGQIAPATRERVRRAAAELGYRPDPVARGLVSGRVGVLGLAVGHMADLPWAGTYRPYYAAFAAGATMAAVERDHALVVVPGDPASGLWTRVPMDGLIIVDPVRDDPLLADCARHGMPVVTDGRPIDPGYDGVPTVESDIEQGMTEMLVHLRESGAVRVGLLSGFEPDAYTQDCERLYRRWCAGTGQAPLVETPAAAEDPVEAALRLLASPGRPDAVHCLNETYGQALVVAARRLGLAVPDDLMISVMRASDQPGGSADWEIPLTTLSLDARRLGVECVATLIDVLDGKQPGGTVVPCSVVVRRSTRRS
ncbi:LacI family transcriptional regulator [Streptomyces somaliensis]|uniref:LacI family DNA-binding transcriptional regulator n=1 Tax=Streptomyces somaliensis TaxID=78355 RepID=UPI0020CDB0D4|nr:LacI family DNA-binding transcriptional regulator [Streptomyces somaliensis]MCP9945265.1 LacI family transcriptional regulator [Streptomyces somaliensis]MCP9961528.1 LacI family transcriptional regulator [Streptomyces somaliensis]MCP9974338.1 LacI family transcriptional regulator [Streptomyces somaliensis]